MPAQRKTRPQRQERADQRAANAAISAAPKKAPVKAAGKSKGSSAKRPLVVKPTPEILVPAKPVDLSKLTEDHFMALELHDRIVKFDGKLPIDATRSAILGKHANSIGSTLDSLKKAWAQIECPGLEVRLYR